MWDTQVPSLGWEGSLEKEWLPTPVFLPREFYGQRSLAGYSPWGCKENSWLINVSDAQQGDSVIHIHIY